MTTTALPYYRSRLREELTRRIDQNPRYSLRSFAKALGVDASALSQILQGKRFLSAKMIDRLLKGLELSPAEQLEFARSVAIARRARGLVRVEPRLREALQAAPAARDERARDLNSDQFRAVADWYHTAIVEMTHLPAFREDPRWIARRLGITPLEARHAIARLIEVGVLERRGARLEKARERVNTLDKSKTSAWHRRRQKQVLEKSIASLDNDPIEKRVHAAVTFAIDPAKIAGARERIQTFIWDMTQYLAKEKPETVYEMTVNLFPLDQGENP